MQQYKDLDKLLNKREIENKQLTKKHERLKLVFSDLQSLFTDTLNVKLRYEKIIKSLLENDKKKDKQSTRQVIKNTKLEEIVVIRGKKKHV